MKQNMTLKRRLPKAAICIALIIAILLGFVPLNNRLTAQAATVPTLTVSTGTLWKYSQSSDRTSISRSTSSMSSAAMTTSQSGNTVTLKESSANKTYSMGYVPIIVSVNVPANTTYHTTMHFELSGNPNKSNSKSTALAYVELFNFGSTDKSSTLTFNTDENKENDHSSRDTLVRDVRETKNFTGSGDVSVNFENNSSSEKTVSYYFGFFSGCMSATKYSHQVEAKCSLSFEKLIESGAVPTIEVNTADVRYNFNTEKNVSYSKDQFVTEKDLKDFFDGVNAAQTAGKMDLIDYKQGNEKYLRGEQLTLSAGTDNLLFSSNKAQMGNSGKMSYVPFTVPITVPANTERTYYLTFKIDYERNTGSGAGFFAELIEGGVPDSFNTSEKAAMTGNTKLRVYSDKGDYHSGRVTVPLTLTNNTGSKKTMYGNYVFFAGYRLVGAYTPDPKYNLKLESIGYASYEDKYYAAVIAQNCTYTHNSVIKTGDDYNAAITPKTGYSLPSTVEVKCGDKELSASQYSWNSGTGKLNIPAKNIRSDISVTANGVPNKYSIKYSGLEGATLSNQPTTHTYGKATTIGNPTKTGYTFAGWKINGGTTAKKPLTLGATSYTADISLEAAWTVNKYTITYTGVTGAALSPKPTTHTYGTATTVGDPTKTGYTFAGWKINNSATATKSLKLGATAYTANISLEATWTANNYSATFSGTKVTKSTGFGANAVTYNTEWTGKFTANTGCDLPSSITVTVGGTALASSKYTYSKSGSTGTVTIPAGNVTGNVAVTASGTLKKYTATLSGANVTATTTGFGTNKVTHNTAWTGTFKANTGCDLPSSITVTVGGTVLTTNYTYSQSGSTGTVTIDAAKVTGAVTVTASGTLKKYDATLSGNNITAPLGFGTGTATYKTAWTGTLQATGGCVLPNSITVKVGSTTLASTRYTYDKSTGKVTIQAAYVTGNITITADGHKHSYTSEVTTPETCTANGVRTFTCSCGHSYTETIPKTGHGYSNDWTTNSSHHWHVCTKCGVSGAKSSHVWNEGEVTTAPTETSTGVKTFTCTVCSATKTEAIAMLNHEHDPAEEWSTDEDEHWHECKKIGCGVKVNPEPHTLTQIDYKAPTCTEKGYKKYTCNICGYEITEEIEVTEHNFGDEWEHNDTNHYHLCTACLTETIGTEEHNWDSGTIEKFPDCTNTGVIRYECTVCGAEKNENIPVDAEAHDWGDWKITVDSTKESNGEIQSVCKLNTEHISTKDIPPLTDTDFWTLVDSTAPSCTEEGSEVYECEYGTVTVSIPENGHTPVTDERKEPTCIEKGLTEGSHCEVCGEVLTAQHDIDLIGHTWNDGEITIQPTEGEAGVKTYTCTVCGTTKEEPIAPLGHTHDWSGNWSKDDTYHWHDCLKDCGEKRENAAHTWDGGVATAEPTEYITGIKTYTCTVCGAAKTELIAALGHTHDWNKEWNRDNFYHWRVCLKDCGEEKDRAAHTWDDGVVTKEPAEDATGIRTRTCTVCGEQKTESIAPLNHVHDWSGDWSKDDAYHWHDCLKNCGEKKDEVAHVWNGGEIAVPPAKDTEGIRTYTCTVCGATKTETIPANSGSDEPETPENPSTPESPENPGKPDGTNNGNVSKEVQPGENAPKTELPTPLDELTTAVLTHEERETVKDGIDIKIILTVEDMTDRVPEEEHTAVESKLSDLTDYKLGQYLDVNLLKLIGESQEKITETTAPITVVFEVPEKLRGKTEYSVIRIHSGETVILPDLDNDVNTVTIETDRFSTYALAYSENPSSTPPGRDNIPTPTPMPMLTESGSDESYNSDTTSSESKSGGGGGSDSAPIESEPTESGDSDLAPIESELIEIGNSDSIPGGNVNSDIISNGGDSLTSSDTTYVGGKDFVSSEDNTDAHDGNPSTGVAASFIPLTIAIGVVMFADKRKKK